MVQMVQYISRSLYSSFSLHPKKESDNLSSPRESQTINLPSPVPIGTQSHPKPQKSTKSTAQPSPSETAPCSKPIQVIHASLNDRTQTELQWLGKDSSNHTSPSPTTSKQSVPEGGLNGSSGILLLSCTSPYQQHHSSWLKSS